MTEDRQLEADRKRIKETLVWLERAWRANPTLSLCQLLVMAAPRHSPLNGVSDEVLVRGIMATFYDMTGGRAVPYGTDAEV